MLQNPVDEAEGLCLFRIQEIIPLAGGGDLFDALAGILGQDAVHPVWRYGKGLYVGLML